MNFDATNPTLIVMSIVSIVVGIILGIQVFRKGKQAGNMGLAVGGLIACIVTSLFFGWLIVLLVGALFLFIIRKVDEKNTAPFNQADPNASPFNPENAPEQQANPFAPQNTQPLDTPFTDVTDKTDQE